MNHSFWTIMAFLCVLVSCTETPNETNDLKITYRTYNIDSKSLTRPSSTFYLEGSAKYHGQYFCLFREDSSIIGKSYYHLLAFQPEKTKVNEISKTVVQYIGIYKTDKRVWDFPRLFVRNDSLLIQGYAAGERDYKYHCMIDSISDEDGLSSWIIKEIPRPSPIVYEDDVYRVTFTNTGNSQYMSFIDKSDFQEHIYRCWGAVFKRPDGYYLCSNTAISRIANPKEGLVHPVGADYHDTPASAPEVLFSPSNPDIQLNAFFMHNDTIYMLETYKDSTYLSKYDGQSISRTKRLEQKMSYIFSSTLGKYYFDNGDTYNFVYETEDGEEHYGIIDIDDNQMTIINLVTNQPSGNNYDIDNLLINSSIIREQMYHWDYDSICNLIMPRLLKEGKK